MLFGGINHVDACGKITEIGIRGEVVTGSGTVWANNAGVRRVLGIDTTDQDGN
jgi:hypothetical protein